jgi:integrase
MLFMLRSDFRRILSAALYTGARYGELRRARVRDYDSASKTLRIFVAKSGRWRAALVHDEAAMFFPQAHERPRAERVARLAYFLQVRWSSHRSALYAGLAVQSGMALIALASVTEAVIL